MRQTRLERSAGRVSHEDLPRLAGLASAFANRKVNAGTGGLYEGVEVMGSIRMATQCQRISGYVKSQPVIIR